MLCGVPSVNLVHFVALPAEVRRASTRKRYGAYMTGPRSYPAQTVVSSPCWLLRAGAEQGPGCATERSAHSGPRVRHVGEANPNTSV